MKVYQAIGAVSAAMSQQGISKGRKNTQQGYNFRGIDDVLNALSTALVEAGLGPRAGVRVLEVLRDNEPLFEPLDTLQLRTGDRLVIAAAPGAGVCHPIQRTKAFALMSAWR